MAPGAALKSEAPARQHCATWLPRDIPYNAVFENSLSEVLTNPPSPTANRGLRIIANDSPTLPEPGVSVRLADIDPAALPTIAFADLPLPLSDPRRTYASPIPGVRLTHPGGYLEGGPGFSPDDDVFAHDFMSRFAISSADQLLDCRDREIARLVQDMRDRMRARTDALANNARLERELKTLMDQREMEVKIETRMLDDARKRREKRDKRRGKSTAASAG